MPGRIIRHFLSAIAVNRQTRKSTANPFHQMNKPRLVVVTGRPASGKTTLAHRLSREIKYPLLSRDELKEGYVNTMRIQHSQLDHATGLHIYETFFELIDLLISRGISFIAEAAFQNKLWKPGLLHLSDKAEIRIIVCEVPPDLARHRFVNRLLSDPERERFHGDGSLIAEQAGLLTEAYEPVNMNVPALTVDTSEHYHPGLQDIIAFVRQ
jgi:predicted kinase